MEEASDGGVSNLVIVEKLKIYLKCFNITSVYLFKLDNTSIRFVGCQI